MYTLLLEDSDSCLSLVQGCQLFIISHEISYTATSNMVCTTTVIFTFPGNLYFLWESLLFYEVFLQVTLGFYQSRTGHTKTSAAGIWTWITLAQELYGLLENCRHHYDHTSSPATTQWLWLFNISISCIVFVASCDGAGDLPQDVKHTAIELSDKCWHGNKILWQLLRWQCDLLTNVGMFLWNLTNAL